MQGKKMGIVGNTIDNHDDDGFITYFRYPNDKIEGNTSPNYYKDQ